MATKHAHTADAPEAASIVNGIDQSIIPGFSGHQLTDGEVEKVTHTFAHNDHYMNVLAEKVVSRMGPAISHNKDSFIPPTFRGRLILGAVVSGSALLGFAAPYAYRYLTMPASPALPAAKK